MVNAARTIAAWEGRKEVLREDIRRAAALALPHRMHRKPFDEREIDLNLLDRLCAEEAEHDK